MNKISIVIPCYNEEKYIENCINSILQSDVKYEDLELFLVDGMSSDSTREIIHRYTQKYLFIKLLDNPEKIVPIAMNIGIKYAKGDYIIRLDAHSSYPKNYFTELVNAHQILDADNIGCAVITDVKHKNKKSCSIKQVLSHKFGVGNSNFRTGITKIQEADTVPFGCFKKDVFLKYGLYDNRLIRNQDIELNKRIINGGGKLYLIPNVKCTYYARENFKDLAKNNYGNGKWNILTAYYTKSLNSLSLRHFIPLIFVLSILLPAILSIIDINFLWISALSLGSYLALVIILSFKLRDETNSMFYLMSSFLILHISYGFGSLIGIFSVLKRAIRGENE